MKLNIYWRGPITNYTGNYSRVFTACGNPKKRKFPRQRIGADIPVTVTPPRKATLIKNGGK